MPGVACPYIRLASALPRTDCGGFGAGYARVLMTTSVESQQGSPGYMPYNAAKWSLMAFQEEWVNTHVTDAQTNIQIVSIMPGTVNTSLGYTGIFGEHTPPSFGCACISSDMSAWLLG